LVEQRPETPQRLLAVHGIGKKKVEQYGYAILAICAKWTRSTPLSSGPSTEHPKTSCAEMEMEMERHRKIRVVQPDDVDMADARRLTRFARPARPSELENTSPQQQQQPQPQPPPPPTDSQTTATPPHHTWTPNPPTTKSPPKHPRGTLHIHTQTPVLLLCYDLETTGLKRTSDDIIQLCVQFVEYRHWLVGTENSPSDLVRVHETYTTFVHTTKHIPHIVTELTGIRDSDVARAPPFSEVYHALVQKVGHWSAALKARQCIWVAHNGFGFDFHFMGRYLACTADRGRALTSLCTADGQSTSRDHPTDTPPHTRSFWCADTQVMVRNMFRDVPTIDRPTNFKLKTLYTHLVGGKSAHAQLTFHRADEDVTAMVEVLRVVVGRSPVEVLGGVCWDGEFGCN